MPEEIINDLQHTVQKLHKPQPHGTNQQCRCNLHDQNPKGRFPDEDEYAKVAGAYKLHARDLGGARENMIIMHPLPRVDEIHPSVDSTRHACYFEQAFNGVVARMSLMCWLLGVKVPETLPGGDGQ